MDVLDFDVEDHRYTRAGVEIPSVTRVMNKVFPLSVPVQRLEFARQMGRAIHLACELYDRSVLDIATLDPQIVPYLEAWQSFRTQTRCSIIEIEQQVYHETLGYAGTLDRIIVLDGEYGVLDLKRPLLTSRVGVQLAGYQYARNAMIRPRFKRADAGFVLPRPVTRRWGLQLRADGTFRLKEYRESTDLSVFLACLTLHNWRTQHADIE